MQVLIRRNSVRHEVWELHRLLKKRNEKEVVGGREPEKRVDSEREGGLSSIVAKRFSFPSREKKGGKDLAQGEVKVKVRIQAKKEEMKNSRLSQVASIPRRPAIFFNLSSDSKRDEDQLRS